MMERDRKPKESIFRLKSPILRYLNEANAKESRMEQKLHGDSFGIILIFEKAIAEEKQNFINLENRRNDFIAFSEREGLGNIQTKADLKNKKESLIKGLQVLEPEQIWERLLELRRQAFTGMDLRSAANEYIKQKTSEDDIKLKGKGVHVSNERLSIVFESDEPQNDSPDDQRPLRLSPIERNIHHDKAAEFARQKEAAIALSLYVNTGNEFQDMFGSDVRTGEPVIFDGRVDTIEDAQRFSRPLTSMLSEWHSRGSTEMDIPYCNDTETYGQIAKILLPEGTSDSLFMEYELAEYKLSEHERPSTSDDYDTLKSDENRILFALRRKMFDETVSVFESTQQLFHPTVEWHARHLAASALEGTFESRRGTAREILKKDEGQPLSDSVLTLKKIAYNAGVYLDPLKEEMAKRLAHEGLNPDQIAETITKTQALPSEQKGNSLKSLTESERWFVEETLYTSSTIDADGKYSKDDPEDERLITGTSRRTEVIEDLINHLHELGNKPKPGKPEPGSG